jgi:UDP-N-acetyl-2-amino-2-deoxyglucuronate dehydrogenase
MRLQSVLLTNGCHAERALKLIENNWHVVIEKPLALSKASCEQIIFKALQKNKYIFYVMQNRYSPPSIWLKDVFNQGILGKI